MNNRKIAIAIMMCFCLTFILGGCSLGFEQNSTSPLEKNTVTDTFGRQIEVDKDIKRIVAIGPGALRLCCYLNCIDMIVGIEQIDSNDSMGKPYVMANPYFKNLSVIGPGGPNNAPDPEKILAVKPQVIFSTYSSEKASLDNLQSKTGIPVIALSYGKTAAFDPEISTSLKLIGNIIGKDKKAQEIVDYIDKCKNDLDTRTKAISKNEKPSTYVGGLGMKGAHGIESTQGNYSLFNIVNAKNVVDETGKTGSIMIDKEKLIQWNPDKIFIDGGGLELIKQDYEKKPEYYKTLSAIKNNEIYLQLPYNCYSTNIDTAIADAYYIGKVLYPEQFKDIEPEKKADEIYKFLLGKELYSDMAKDYGGFKKAELTYPL